MMPIPMITDKNIKQWNNNNGLTPDFWFLNTNNNNIISTWSQSTSTALSGPRWFKNNVGSFNVTMFTIHTGDGSEVRYGYDPIPGDLGPGGNGSYDLGQNTHAITFLGGFTTSEIRKYYNYNGTAPNQTIPNSTATLQSVDPIRLFISQTSFTGSINNRTPVISLAKHNGTLITPTSGNGGISIDGDTSTKNSIVRISSITDVKEVIIYFSTLTSGNITTVENYLKSKYSITY